MWELLALSAEGLGAGAGFAWATIVSLTNHELMLNVSKLIPMNIFLSDVTTIFPSIFPQSPTPIKKENVTFMRLHSNPLTVLPTILTTILWPLLTAK
jgi:hypothetical protein